MKAWIAAHRSSALIVGASLIIPLGIVVYLLTSLWLQRMEYQGDIDRLKPRIARLQGLLESQDALLGTSGRVQTRIDNLVFDAQTSRQAVGAKLQTDIRQMMIDGGLRVTDIRILPAVEQESVLGQVGLRLTVSGSMEALDSGLTALAEYRPRVVVQYLDVKPDRGRARRGEKVKAQVVTASIQLVALKRQM